jgi:hypothetical protein
MAEIAGDPITAAAVGTGVVAAAAAAAAAARCEAASLQAFSICGTPSLAGFGVRFFNCRKKKLHEFSKSHY